MVTVQIGKHAVEIYNGIDELPIVRFHKYQKMVLIDAGIGGDITAFDQRAEKARRFLAKGDTEKAAQELDNMRQCVFFVQQGLNPKHRAFATLVAKIDGIEYPDVTDATIERILQVLQDVPEKELTAQLDAVKKKIDDELLLYFPSLFNTSDVKEYYDLLKKRTLAVLDNIAAGKENPIGAEVEKITTELLTYSKPKIFTGSAGAEIQHDRQFENLCLALSEQLHVEPKKYTVLEFYNAFDFLRDRMKQAEKAQTGRNKAR